MLHSARHSALNEEQQNKMLQVLTEMEYVIGLFDSEQNGQYCYMDVEASNKPILALECACVRITSAQR